jgi:hypothetical protein
LKGEKFMIFNQGELPQEQEEPEDLEGILEWEEIWILESEPAIDPIPEYVPQDDYLEKELEREREEELAEMLPDRIP